MWPRLINALLGVWLMAAPNLLGYEGLARTNDRIIGPIAASFAVIAMWEVTRPVRRVNLVLGLWLLLAPWVLGYSASTAIFNSLVVGLFLGLFALVRGQVRQQFGGGWSSLWRSASESKNTG